MEMWKCSLNECEQHLKNANKQIKSCDIKITKISKKRKSLIKKQKIYKKQSIERGYFVHHPLYNQLQHLPLVMIDLCKSYMTEDLCKLCGLWHPIVLKNCVNLNYTFEGNHQILNDNLIFDIENDNEVWNFICLKLNPSKRKLIFDVRSYVQRCGRTVIDAYNTESWDHEKIIDKQLCVNLSCENGIAYYLVITTDPL